MRCEDVRPLMAVYLDGEITPAERALIQAHLSQCDDCQHRLAALTVTRSVLKQALHARADQAAPPPHAWAQVQARLAEESRQYAPRESRSDRLRTAFTLLTHHLSGVPTMYKSLALTGLAVILAAVFAIAYLPQNATQSVSAQDILDRAYTARQAAAQPLTEGIQHTLTESYRDYSDLTVFKDTAEGTSLSEGYLDLQTHQYRWVITDKATGALLNVSGYDGTYLYSNIAVEDAPPTSEFTIYRTAQSPEVMNQWGIAPTAPVAIDAELAFESMRDAPEVELLEQASWVDGRPVYVLRSPGVPVRTVSDSVEGFTTMYFDVDTYRLLEYRDTVVQDGQEVVISYTRFLVDEILPAGTPVVWDLNDLQDVVFVDDPDGELANLILPEPMTLDELLALTPAVYVLNTIPESFVMEISVADAGAEEAGPYYSITYHDQDSSYLTLQSTTESERWLEQAQSTYTTASGLILNLEGEVPVTGTDITYTSAFVQAPDGVSFLLSSNLPREQVEALAEDLILASPSSS